MPLYSVGPCVFDVSRNVAIIDTNSIYAYFDSHERAHEDVKTLLDEYLPELGVEQYIVPSAVAVEAWNLLVRGRRLRAKLGWNFIDWLIGPGSNAIVLPQDPASFDASCKYGRAQDVDIVDAITISCAATVSNECEIRPPVMIVTADADFLRCIDPKSPAFRIFDPRTLEVLP